MSEIPNKEDELAGTEQPFVQHLMELRDRLVKAAIAVGIAAALLFFYPGPGQLYDLLAAPLVAHLPKGATLIATSVISPFMVPLKILFVAAFLLVALVQIIFGALAVWTNRESLRSITRGYARFGAIVAGLVALLWLSGTLAPATKALTVWVGVMAFAVAFGLLSWIFGKLGHDSKFNL